MIRFHEASIDRERRGRTPPESRRRKNTGKRCWKETEDRDMTAFLIMIDMDSNGEFVEEPGFSAGFRVGG
jgi:hypothetical protein